LTVFHITTAREAHLAAEPGVYTPERFALEGFIHCSYAGQVCGVANRLFRGRTDLVLLEVDCGRLSCDVVDENLEGGTELFPHVYGPLPMAAVVRVHAFPCSAGGRFDLPQSMQPPV